MHNIRVLIVEDELKLQALIQKYLVRENYQVFTATSGSETFEIFDKQQIDLIVLDLMLPDISGYKIAERIRQYSEVPIIMLTARSEEQDKLDGFSTGADDYVTKPFSPRELLARIKVLLRRNKKLLKSEIIKHGNFTLDATNQSIYINDLIIDFTPGELELLYYFLLNFNITLSRDKIIDRIWGYDYDGDARAVDTRIKRVRRKLANAEINITTVRGIGYRMEVQNEV